MESCGKLSQWLERKAEQDAKEKRLRQEQIEIDDVGKGSD
jgi:hypothetical protein